MNNFEKYTKLHNEVMERLESGEITTEMTKEVINLSFDKYIIHTESKAVSEYDKRMEQKRARYSINKSIQKLKDLKLSFRDLYYIAYRNNHHEIISEIENYRKEIASISLEDINDKTYKTYEDKVERYTKECRRLADLASKRAVKNRGVVKRCESIDNYGKRTKKYIDSDNNYDNDYDDD